MTRYIPVKELIIGDKIYIHKKWVTIIDLIPYEVEGRKRLRILHIEGTRSCSVNSLIEKWKIPQEEIHVSKKNIEEMEKKPKMNPIDVAVRLTEYNKEIKKWRFKVNRRLVGRSHICSCNLIIPYGEYCGCGK